MHMSIKRAEFKDEIEPPNLFDAKASFVKSNVSRSCGSLATFFAICTGF